MIRWLTHILDVKNILGMQRTLLHTIRFENWDGTLLEEVQVLDGQTPVYSGATPTRPSDAQYNYWFDSWSPAIAPATADATYIATYTTTLVYYTVNWYNYDGTLLETRNWR